MAVWSAVAISNLGHAQRMEAEYYRPHYLEIAEKLARANAVPITRFLDYLTDGTHVTPKYVAKGIPFLSSSDIDPFLISPNIEKFISEAEHASLQHCQPKAGDILVSLVSNGVTAFELSHSLYLSAVKILESELGLDDFVFTKPMGYWARFSELEVSLR